MVLYDVALDIWLHHRDWLGLLALSALFLTWGYVFGIGIGEDSVAKSPRPSLRYLMAAPCCSIIVIMFILASFGHGLVSLSALLIWPAVSAGISFGVCRRLAWAYRQRVRWGILNPAMEGKGWNHFELADRAGLERHLVEKYWRGELEEVADPDLKKLAGALGIPIDCMPR